MAKAKVEPKKEEAPKPPPPPPVEKESAPLTPPRNIKNEAKKFEVKAEGDDELTGSQKISPADLKREGFFGKGRNFFVMVK